MPYITPSNDRLEINEDAIVGTNKLIKTKTNEKVAISDLCNPSS
jgi:hypothetical protein